MRPGEWLDLMSDDTPALRAQFFGATPPVTQMYWRGPVLWDFDGRTWTQPGWLRASARGRRRTRPGALGLRDRTRADRPQRYLVALDLPLAAPEGARLSLDHGLCACAAR